MLNRGAKEIKIDRSFFKKPSSLSPTLLSLSLLGLNRDLLLLPLLLPLLAAHFYALSVAI